MGEDGVYDLDADESEVQRDADGECSPLRSGLVTMTVMGMVVLVAHDVPLSLVTT